MSLSSKGPLALIQHVLTLLTNLSSSNFHKYSIRIYFFIVSYCFCNNFEMSTNTSRFQDHSRSLEFLDHATCRSSVLTSILKPLFLLDQFYFVYYVHYLFFVRNILFLCCLPYRIKHVLITANLRR